MKILHINTFDTGGAAKACIRLHLGLLAEGYDSSFLSLFRYSSGIPNHYVYENNKINIYDRVWKNVLYKYRSYRTKNILRNKPKFSSQFTFPDSTFDITTTKVYQEADIIHLHWVANFLDYKSFFKKNKKKIVWTPHDMNPFTGGCHYSLECNFYKKDCKVCLQLSEEKKSQVTSDILSCKANSIASSKNYITVVSLSNWMYQCSTSSSIFNNVSNTIIPNSIDTSVFKPIDQRQARITLGLPLEKKIIFFVSDDLNNELKGLKTLIQSLSMLGMENDLMLLTVGKANSNLSNLNISHKHLGYVSEDEKLALAYNSSDILVNPSLAESFSLITIEAMACGIPVIAFKVGGLLDLVREKKTGLLAEVNNSNDLTEKILWLLNNDEERIKMGEYSRNVAREEYDTKIQTKKYVRLYTSLL